MKKQNIILIALLPLIAQADFLNYIEYQNEVGREKACEKIELFSGSVGLYEQAYFYNAIRNCERRKTTHAEAFKNLPKEEKNKYYTEYAKTYDPSYVEAALKSNEIPHRDLLDLVGPRLEFPELYEVWRKKKIDMYLNHPLPAPNENEGDVHSPVNFVRSDYESMIEAYVRNDKLENAQRLAREYGENYRWSSQEDTKALMERIEKQKAYFAKKKTKEAAEENERQKPAAPNKVTAKLTEAIEAYDEAKANTKANTSEGISVKEDNVKNKEPEFSLHAMHEKYNLFIVAIVIVVGMYLVSLMRRKSS